MNVIVFSHRVKVARGQKYPSPLISLAQVPQTIENRVFDRCGPARFAHALAQAARYTNEPPIKSAPSIP